MAELVALELPQGPELAAAIEEAWSAGDAVTVLDERWAPAARRRALRALRPTLHTTPSSTIRIDDGVEADDGDALVVLTSGSLSDPKAAVLSHDAVAASAQMTSSALGVDPERHRWLCCLPTSHIGGLSVIARSIVTGTPLEVIPRADAAELDRRSRAGCTHVSVVATTLQRADLSSFEVVVVGGSAPPATRPENVVTTYGMTETGSGVVYDGRPLPGVELAIAGAGDDGIGEILVHTPSALRSYRDRPAAFVVGPDGRPDWLATGDLGRLDSGELTVRGRTAEVVVTGGEKVYPGDVESILAQVDGVREVAVWKRPDPEWGERVVAWVVPDGEAPSLERLRDAVRDQLAAYAAPKELVVVDELPRTSIGKLRRQALS